MEGLFAILACLGYLAYKIVPPILEGIEKEKAEKADAEFLREHPAAWKAREDVRLARERQDAEKELAHQEGRRRNAGLVAGFLTSLFK